MKERGLFAVCLGLCLSLPSAIAETQFQQNDSSKIQLLQTAEIIKIDPAKKTLKVRDAFAYSLEPQEQRPSPNSRDRLKGSRASGRMLRSGPASDKFGGGSYEFEVIVTDETVIRNSDGAIDFAALQKGDRILL